MIKTIFSERRNLRVLLPDGFCEYGDVVQAAHRCVLERPHQVREDDCGNVMNNLLTREYRRANIVIVKKKKKHTSLIVKS